MFGLRFVPGARPGKAPNRPSMSAVEAAKKWKKINEAYEKKRVLEFQTHWQIARDWLSMMMPPVCGAPFAMSPTISQISSKSRNCG